MKHELAAMLKQKGLVTVDEAFCHDANKVRFPDVQFILSQTRRRVSNVHVTDLMAVYVALFTTFVCRRCRRLLKQIRLLSFSFFFVNFVCAHGNS